MFNLINEKKIYRQESGFNLIELHLNEVHQLFNSLDPSPFKEKDLDSDAEHYIWNAAKDLPLKAPLKIVVYLPAEQLVDSKTLEVPQAIHHYFEEGLISSWRNFKTLLKVGRIRLIIGLIFLFVSISISKFLANLTVSTHDFSDILADSLVILGWVSMWDPIQIFLYEWWPVLNECRLYQKLRGTPVEVRQHLGVSKKEGL